MTMTNKICSECKSYDPAGLDVCQCCYDTRLAPPGTDKYKKQADERAAKLKEVRRMIPKFKQVHEFLEGQTERMPTLILVNHILKEAIEGIGGTIKEKPQPTEGEVVPLFEDAGGESEGQ